jgi:DNA-binding HxlR family transcriptional regulator
VEVTLDVIGGKWKSVILWHLKLDAKRYSELRKLIPGVTARMLTNQLRELEQDDVIKRTVFAEVPPRVEYALTETGKSLRPLLDALGQWGKRRAQKS